jgi:hypothetical protein
MARRAEAAKLKWAYGAISLCLDLAQISLSEVSPLYQKRAKLMRILEREAHA